MLGEMCSPYPSANRPRIGLLLLAAPAELRRATARWDTMTTTIVTVDDDDNDDNGDGATGDEVDDDDDDDGDGATGIEVDDDGDNDDYGNG